MEMLKESSSSISEIAFETGFHSVTYFTKCFHDHYGYSPGKVGKGESEMMGSENPPRNSLLRWFGKKRISLTIFFSVIFIFIAAIILLIVFMPFISKDQPVEKSIAVLPFLNDSPEETEMYFINGTMESILNKLSAIKDLRVVSRHSVEQYRNYPKPVPEIARELNVSYILEGSGQKYGNRIRLTVQLIDGTSDRHIWSDVFESDINQIEELFSIQSEIAQKVASEIEATITPEEKKLIEKIPTHSHIAYEFQQRGNEELRKYNRDNSDLAALQKAEDLYHISLEYDSTFALAYQSLGWVYMHRQNQDIDHSEAYLDSVRKYLDSIFRYDNQMATAYFLRGTYYRTIGEMEKAVEDFQEIFKLEPNNELAFEGLAGACWDIEDYVCTIENFHQSLLLQGSSVNDGFFRILDGVYLLAGFKEQSNYYSKRALDQDGDSAAYLANLGMSEYLISNNLPRAVEYLQHGYRIDPGNLMILKNLAEIFLDLGQHKKSLRYFEEYISRLDALGQVDIFGSHLIGYAYLINGNREKAEYYFDLQTKYSNKTTKSSKRKVEAYALISAWRGEKEQAMEHLRQLNQIERTGVYVLRNFKEDFLYKSIQNEPEFIKIKSELIAKYQAEHERVRKWLEEHDML